MIKVQNEKTESCKDTVFQQSFTKVLPCNVLNIETTTIASHLCISSKQRTASGFRARKQWTCATKGIKLDKFACGSAVGGGITGNGIGEEPREDISTTATGSSTGAADDAGEEALEPSGIASVSSTTKVPFLSPGTACETVIC